ncbi:TPA: hypothetical protein ACG3DC_001501, partial [Stenotrophomonas maltophilia]
MLDFCWLGGAVWACRTRRKPIHGANGPAGPHRPTPDRFTRLLVGVDLGRHGRRQERLKDRFLILIFLIFPVVVAARKELSGAGWAGG